MFSKPVNPNLPNKGKGKSKKKVSNTQQRGTKRARPRKSEEARDKEVQLDDYICLYHPLLVMHRTMILNTPESKKNYTAHLLTQAQMNFAFGHLGETVNLLTMALTIAPDKYPVYLERAVAFRYLQQNVAAIMDCKHALTIRCTSELLELMAHVYAAMGDAINYNKCHEAANDENIIADFNNKLL